jgi:xylan 1,4-beta-xylosidase
VLSWAFEFEDQPYFAGFRQLTSAGIDLPVMNVFKLFSKMGGTYVSSISDRQIALDKVMNEGVRDSVDVGSVATLDKDTLAVLVWHYHDDDVAGPDALVHLNLRGLPKTFSKGATVTHYRVDKKYSNSYAAWLEMGSPIAPTTAQRAALLKAAELVTLDEPGLKVSRRAATLDFRLPRQGVSLLLLKADQ